MVVIAGTAFGVMNARVVLVRSRRRVTALDMPETAGVANFVG